MKSRKFKENMKNEEDFDVQKGRNKNEKLQIKANNNKIET